MKNKNSKKFLLKCLYVVFYIFFVAVVFFRLGTVFYNARNDLFKREYHEKYSQLYNSYYSSQYVKKDKPNIIPDNVLEAFAGGVFLTGLNPILIIHDQPPLGRYIVSLSILLFDNSSTLTFFLQSFSIVGLVLISKKIFQNFLIALLPIAIFVNEPLFLNQFLFTPTLEPLQQPFIVFSIYFFMNGVSKKKYLRWFMLTAVMLGFVISIRFFSLGAAIVLAFLLYFFFEKKFNKRFLLFALTLPLSILVLILSYTRTILDGYSILQVFSIQKYILYYHVSKFTLPFTVWDLLLFNRWHTWWGERIISSDSQWRVTWPISTILSIINMMLVIMKGNLLAKSEKVIICWVVVYLIFLSSGYSTTRYFLPLIPFLYVLGFSVIVKVIKMYRMIGS